MRVRLQPMLCVILSAVLLGVPVHGMADAFDRARRAINLRVGQADLSGFSLHGGAALQSGTVGTHATLLRGQAHVGKLCGGFDLASSLSEAFATIPDLLYTLVQQLLSNMPMLVLCYSSPSLCDLAKHVQSLVSALISARFSQCTQVQTAMAYSGLKLRGGAIAQCLEDEATAGTPLGPAMQRCMQTVQRLRLPNGLTGSQMSLVQDTMTAAGASQEMRTLAQTLLGDVTLQVSNGGLGVTQSRPHGAMMQRYETHRVSMTTSLQAAVAEVQATGTISPTTLEAISVPGQPLPKAALDALVALRSDPVRYDSYVQKLATNLSLAKLTWECGEVQDQLASSIESTEQLSDEQRHLLERRLAALDRELQQVRAKKRVIEQDLQPAVDALLQEYAKVQSLATQAALRAPRLGTPAMPFDTQAPSGYGH